MLVRVLVVVGPVLVEVAVEDDAIFLDIDTPDALRAIRAKEEKIAQ